MRITDRRRWVPYAAVACAVALALAVAAYEQGWRNLFVTPDQRGRLLMHRGEAKEAASAFRDPLWRGVALFRAGDFKGAADLFGSLDTAEGAYDEATALVMLGKYDDAVKRYDQALALRPGWPDAVANREIARIRAERMRLQGGVTGDTESKPDEVVFDKTKKGGENATVQSAEPAMSDAAVRALWLKRVQTRPADFLRMKFAYQLQNGPSAPPP
jgi:Ca-activated chloride channel family protein